MAEKVLVVAEKVLVVPEKVLVVPEKVLVVAVVVGGCRFDDDNTEMGYSSF